MSTGRELVFIEHISLIEATDKVLLIYEDALMLKLYLLNSPGLVQF